MTNATEQEKCIRQDLPEELRMYTVKDVAKIFSLTAQTVRKMVKEGTLSAHRLPSGKLLISESALKIWLAAAVVEVEVEDV